MQSYAPLFGILISNLLKEKGLDEHEVKAAIIGSVVPNIMHSLQNGLIKYFNIRPIIVEAGIKTGIRIATPNPQQIGADRIVDAVAAYELYGYRRDVPGDGNLFPLSRP